MDVTLHWKCHDNSKIKAHCHVPGFDQARRNIYLLSPKLVHQNLTS